MTRPAQRQREKNTQSTVGYDDKWEYESINEVQEAYLSGEIGDEEFEEVLDAREDLFKEGDESDDALQMAESGGVVSLRHLALVAGISLLLTLVLMSALELAFGVGGITGVVASAALATSGIFSLWIHGFI